MELISPAKQKTHTEQCIAKTATGKRCKRKASEDQLCSQHLEKWREQFTPWYDLPAGQLQRIPEAPPDYHKQVARQWHHVCYQLYERGDLTGAVLATVEKLCFMEGELIEVRENIKKDGLYNEYLTETGSLVRQRNAHATNLDRLLSNIRNLRADLKLDPATAPAKSSGSKPANPFIKPKPSTGA
jgi:phage terminase small subunit